MTTTERVTYAAGGFDQVEQGGNVAGRETVEIPAETVNADALHAQARAALAQNRAAISAAPASVTLRQAVDQIQRLSAQNNVLIRLVIGLLDDTD
jgi:hypothetical protein